MTDVAIYARVSTADQNVDMQVKELKKVARKRNWKVTQTIIEKMSGAKGRYHRRGLDELLTAVTKREVDVVLCWAVDRLGRSLTDLVATMNTIKEVGADLYIHQSGIDTSTSAGKALFGMVAVFAEFERDMIRERVNAGLAVAREKGVKLGRPTVKKRLVVKIEDALQVGKSVRQVAKELKSSVGTVSRIRKKMVYDFGTFTVSKDGSTAVKDTESMSDTDFKQYAKKRIKQAKG